MVELKVGCVHCSTWVYVLAPFQAISTSFDLGNDDAQAKVNPYDATIVLKGMTPRAGNNYKQPWPNTSVSLASKHTCSHKTA